MRLRSEYGFSRPSQVLNVMDELLKRGSATIAALGMLMIAALMAGCGGGAGGDGAGAGVSAQIVSGVAATGAPLAGQVTIRDSSSVRRDKVTIIGSDGSFAIDVADMTAPFILRATGTAEGVSRTLFSFADRPGIANINPLSSAALANAAGVDDPATVFNNPDGANLALVASRMPGSIEALRTKLMPLLNAFDAGGINPVTGIFAADHDGLDAVFDNVNVAISNGTLTITNATTGAVIFTARIRDVEGGRFTDHDDDLPRPGLRPDKPTGVQAVGGVGQVTVSWSPVANATSYDLFYKARSGFASEEEEDVEDEHTIRVRNVISPFVVAGLAPSTTYSFFVRALNDGRKGPPSAKVRATTSATPPPPPIVPSAPTGVSVSAGTRQVTIAWPAVSGATSYNLYWSTTAGVTTANGTKISGVTNLTVHARLTESTTYFYVVTAVNSAGESAASAQVSATTLGGTSTTTTTAPTTTTTAAGTTTTAAGTTTTAAGTTTTAAGMTTTAAGTTTTAAGTTTTATGTTTTATGTTTTTTTTSTTTTTTLAINGAALYAMNCSSCHNPLASSEKRGASASQINAGIAGVNNMRNSIFATNGGVALTQAQITAISAALQ